MPDTLTSPTLAQFSTEIAALVASAAPATVAIQTGVRRSSGFVWRPDVVVAASEALGDVRDGEVEIITPAGTMRARLAGRDPSTDIAILTGAGIGGTALTLSPPIGAALGEVAVGEVAVVVGRSHQGLSCAVGSVSLVGPEWESMRGGRIDSRIALDRRIERHQEGGPVLNAAGAVLGMAVFGPHRRTLVIPAATIERVAPLLLQDGRIRRGYLGVAGQPVRSHDTTGQAPRAALMVLSLDRDGPAHKAGILQGDMILSVAGKAIGGPRQLWRALGPDTVGTSVPCEVVRGGQRTTVDVTIGERQPPAAAKGGHP